MFMCERCNFQIKLCNILEINYPDLCFVKINSQIKVIKMKKLKMSMITAAMLLLFVPAQMKAENEKSTASIAGVTNVETKSNTIAETDAIELAESNAQLARLEEINAMDMSTLSKSEKKELREEVKSIEKDQQRWGRRDRDRRGNSDYDGRSDNNYRRHGGGEIFIFGGGGLLLLILLLLLLY